MRRVVCDGVVAFCLLSILTVSACGQSGETEPAGQGVSEADASKARQLFQDENCTMCHGIMTQGVEELGPALRQLEPYWDRERLTVYLEDPGAFRDANPDFEERREESFDMEMPDYDYLSVEQRQLLADWLLTR